MDVHERWLCECRQTGQSQTDRSVQTDRYAHPTDWARGLVELSDTNTWQANLWSAGCFVMKPKYLHTDRP